MKTLYRPVGLKELELIVKEDFKKFPPRLEQQPIFYPVLNKEYACEIASKWNTKDAFGDYLGFVTEFDISNEEFSKYEVQNVGASHHNELWVPAEKLAEFNNAIVGRIKTIKVYIGEKYKQTIRQETVEYLEIENTIHEARLNHFLETKTREILPYSDFELDLNKDQPTNSSSNDDFYVLKEKARTIDTVDEAVDFLIEEGLSQERIEEIQNETALRPIKCSIKNHFGLNMFLRNLFFYPKNEKLQQSIRAYNSIDANYGEHGEGIIANALWRRLHNCELATSPNKSEIETLRKKLAAFYKQFAVDDDIDLEKITFEEMDAMMDEVDKARKKHNIEADEKRLELLSYNFTKEQIDRYISISTNEEKSLEMYFQEELILANVAAADMPTLQKLKNAYFNTLEVVEKLKFYET
jgi:hypothetical protein